MELVYSQDNKDDTFAVLSVLIPSRRPGHFIGYWKKLGSVQLVVISKRILNWIVPEKACLRMPIRKMYL